MTDAVLRTLLAILRHNGVSGVANGDGSIDVFRTVECGDKMKIGTIAVAGGADGDVIKAQNGRKSGSLPLCSPWIPDMLGRVFGKPAPKWDPNR